MLLTYGSLARSAVLWAVCRQTFPYWIREGLPVIYPPSPEAVPDPQATGPG
jgi:hypothetical protein